MGCLGLNTPRSSPTFLRFSVMTTAFFCMLMSSGVSSCHKVTLYLYIAKPKHESKADAQIPSMAAQSISWQGLQLIRSNFYQLVFIIVFYLFSYFRLSLTNVCSLGPYQYSSCRPNDDIRMVQALCTMILDLVISVMIMSLIPQTQTQVYNPNLL